VRAHKAAVDERRRADFSRWKLDVASKLSRARIEAQASTSTTGQKATTVRQLQAKVSREMARHDGYPRRKRRRLLSTARSANLHEKRPRRQGKVRSLGGFQPYDGPGRFYSPHSLTLGAKIELLKEAGRLRTEGKSLEPVNVELRKFGLEWRAPVEAA
jgi:hypothetical protein